MSFTNFWLSLFPFVTAWMGENHFQTLPVALYGVVSFMSGVAYTLLAKALAALHGPTSAIAVALGRDFKGKISLGIYAAAIGLAFVNPWIALVLIVAVAAMWFVPDRRFEHAA